MLPVPAMLMVLGALECPAPLALEVPELIQAQDEVPAYLALRAEDDWRWGAGEEDDDDVRPAAPAPRARSSYSRSGEFLLEVAPHVLGAALFGVLGWYAQDSEAGRALGILGGMVAGAGFGMGLGVYRASQVDRPSAVAIALLGLFGMLTGAVAGTLVAVVSTWEPGRPRFATAAVEAGAYATGVSLIYWEEHF